MPRRNINKNTKDSRRKKETDFDEEEGVIKIRKRKKNKPPKPWGKKERLLVFSVFIVTVLMAAFLSLGSRSWKLPGLSRIEIPKIKLFSSETVVIGPGKSKTDEQYENEKEIKDVFDKLTDDLTGVYSYYIVDLKNNYEFGSRDKTVMQAASLIKLPVFTTLYQEAEKGNIDLDSIYTLKNSDKVGGSGSLSSKAEGIEITYRKLAEYMGKQSDNTAFNILKNLLGKEKVQSVTYQIGMDDTSLAENETTAFDVGIFFEKLYDGEIVNDQSKNEIIGFLTDTIYEDWISKGIPNVRVAHKYGREINVTNDAGIVFSKNPFVLVILSEGIIYKESDEVIPEIAKMVFEKMNN